MCHGPCHAPFDEHAEFAKNFRGNLRSWNTAESIVARWHKHDDEEKDIKKEEEEHQEDKRGDSERDNGEEGEENKIDKKSGDDKEQDEKNTHDKIDDQRNSKLAQEKDKMKVADGSMAQDGSVQQDRGGRLDAGNVDKAVSLATKELEGDLDVCQKVTERFSEAGSWNATIGKRLPGDLHRKITPLEHVTAECDKLATCFFEDGTCKKKTCETACKYGTNYKYGCRTPRFRVNFFDCHFCRPKQMWTLTEKSMCTRMNNEEEKKQKEMDVEFETYM